MRSASSPADSRDRSCADHVTRTGFVGFVVEDRHSRSSRLHDPADRIHRTQRREANRLFGDHGGEDDGKSAATLPAKMTAIAISEPGGPLVLKPEKRDLPELREGEILIRVRAAGVNRPDVQQRKGAYPPPPGASDLPGLEVAGEVAALGPNVKRWRVGDRGLRADAGRRLCRILPGARDQRAAAAGRLHLHRGRGAAGNLLHRLAQCVRARRR